MFFYIHFNLKISINCKKSTLRRFNKYLQWWTGFQKSTHNDIFSMSNIFKDLSLNYLVFKLLDKKAPSRLIQNYCNKNWVSSERATRFLSVWVEKRTSFSYEKFLYTLQCTQTEFWYFLQFTLELAWLAGRVWLRRVLKNCRGTLW